MLKLGNWNELVIVRFTDHGAYLDGGDVGEVLMPKSYVLREMHPGDRVRVFVYLSPVPLSDSLPACACRG